MERCIMYFPDKDALPDWSALLEPFGNRVVVTYEFETGKLCAEMEPDTLAEIREAYTDLIAELIASR